jgi:hypothetical protein
MGLNRLKFGETLSQGRNHIADMGEHLALASRVAIKEEGFHTRAVYLISE